MRILKEGGFGELFILNFLIFAIVNILLVPRILRESASQFTFTEFGFIVSNILSYTFYSYIILVVLAAAFSLVFSFVIAKMKSLKDVRGLSFFFSAEIILFFTFVYFLFLKWFH